MFFILFCVLECDLDLNGLESLGLEGGLSDEVFCGNDLSPKYKRDLYLGRESHLYGDLWEDVYGER